MICSLLTLCDKNGKNGSDEMTDGRCWIFAVYVLHSLSVQYIQSLKLFAFME